MNIIEILDRPIAFHRCLVAVTGSVTGALLLSQAIYWQNRPTRDSNDGWWYKTTEDFREETGLGRYEFEKARKDCHPYLLHKLKGVPSKSWYKVDAEALQARLLETSKLVPVKPTTQVAGNQQTICTETKAETNTYMGRPRSILDLKDIMAAKERKMEQIRKKHASDVAFGIQWDDLNHKTEYLQLKREVMEINNQIASM